MNFPFWPPKGGSKHSSSKWLCNSVRELKLDLQNGHLNLEIGGPLLVILVIFGASVVFVFASARSRARSFARMHTFVSTWLL
jgi:hypothetical protein